MNTLGKGQSGRAWDELHPLQQAFIPRDHYIECFSKKGSTPNITKVRTLESHEETVAIPGAGSSAPGTAVTVELTSNVSGKDQVEKVTFHEFLIDGKWRFTVHDGDAYKNGGCPA